MAEYSSIGRHGPVLPIDVAQLIMDALFDASSPEDHCYRNQDTYRSWSLVCQSWRMYAQSLLFRIVELKDPIFLRRFSAHLDSAPRLALYVRSLRIYSRSLFTPDNVFSVLPDEIKDKLPNLRALAVTRISGADSWHPLFQAPLSLPELSYMPLSEDFHTRLAPLTHITTLKLYFVNLPCFCVLARIVRAFHNLRQLAIIEVHWTYWDLPAFMLKSATAEERDGFLPNIEDLTLSWLGPHGPEHILAAIGSSGARSLKHLYIDCPLFPADSDSDSDDGERRKRLLDLDLAHFTSLRDLWVSIPYPLPKLLGVDPGIVDTFAALLASWAPASGSSAASAPGWGEEGTGNSRGRTLTVTPTFESDFTRAQFVDVLRAFAPVVEASLLGSPSSSDRYDDADAGICVCVCVIDRPENRAWWADTVARECFPRMYAEGRVRAEFWKRYWDDPLWLEDTPPPAVAEDQAANTTMLYPADADPGAPGTLNVLPEEGVDADAGPRVLRPEEETLPGFAENVHSSLVTPPRGGRRSRGRSFKKVPGLVLAGITKVVRALARRNA